MSATPQAAFRSVEQAKPVAAPVAAAAAGAATHGWQALAGFGAGGLVTAVLMMGSAALSASELWAGAGRFGGFALGGALGGAALAWGLPRGRGPGRGALAFALGMLIPAFLAGPAIAEIISFQPERDLAALSLASLIAFSTGYGLGGAISMSFVWPKLFWSVGWRFFFAGGLGGLLCAWGATLAGDPASLTRERAILSASAILLGHLTPFALGGWLSGRAVDAELKAPSRSRG